MHRKGVAVVSAIVCLMSGLIFAATPASASTSCFTRSHHYSLSDGSVSLRVGWTDFSMQVCTDGREITSANATTDSDTTGPGDAAGFDIDFYNPHPTSFRSGGPTTAGVATFATTGRLRDCIPYTTTFCSDSENFAEGLRVDMYSAPDRIPYALPPGSGWFSFHGRWFRFLYSAKCTNSVCGVHFH